VRVASIVMQLNETQSRELLRTHCVYVTDVCDQCGQILGYIRWTRRNQTGEWCSRVCRDGVDHSPSVCRGCGTSLVGKRRGSMYCGRTCRMRTVRKQVRNRANIVNTPIQNTAVADAISGFGYGDSRKDQNANKQPRIDVNHECEDAIR
jgi:hypothetical protein